jgi:DNA-binding CsgD family transcriptional regulator
LEDLQLDETIEIASSSYPLLERAQALLERIELWMPVDATWMALSDPDSNVYSTVGSTGLDRSVRDFLARPSVAQEVQQTGYSRRVLPFSVGELPVAADELPSWAECLSPAGFREGLGVALFEPDGHYAGMLSLLTASAQPPSAAMRDGLTQLAPLMARGLSPMRSLLATARLVEGGAAGAVLHQDGTTRRLSGLEDHPVLVADSPVLKIARDALHAGHVYRSFMWPAHSGPGDTGYVGITVLAATDVPAFVLGTVVLTPDAHCRDLTPRELQVLGLIVDGRSNQQIARRLAIATRTVAAHIEHILHKLDAATRTLAAVMAEREGCYVPPSSGRQARR